MLFRPFKANSFPKLYHANWKYRLLLFWLVTLFITSCMSKNMDIYQEDEIDGYSIEEMGDGTLVLTVSPMAETLFWCPGAILEEKEDMMLIGLVRCHIDSECPVDVAATLHPTRHLVYKI
ncbi:MAG: hypothetical protein LGR52_10765, partial [Candidatus Thiosymbion ectosymbiont of Robbea hypermnestra]|nr:hypothetical protein [Candidatus Thiosymbion ectosymbiont of Robbea hypermnestra]